MANKFNNGDSNLTVRTTLNNNADEINANTAALANKQALLVSGTNIKTVNGISLVGSGNVSISGDGGSSNDYTDADKIKLDGIETQATKNDTDSNLKSRANHTGTQAISTITSLQAALDSKAQLENSKVKTEQLPDVYFEGFIGDGTQSNKYKFDPLMFRDYLQSLPGFGTGKVLSSDLVWINA